MHAKRTQRAALVIATCVTAAGLALIVTNTPTRWDGNGLQALALLWLYLGQRRRENEGGATALHKP
ncbi:hypothetical protein [Micromonospora sp. NPDC048063]|uniref:hypothetical protein n=1 Tax=Micromonospora sp. NPDC048063 TaxID=3364256 RepID=UPI00371B31D7